MLRNFSPTGPGRLRLLIGAALLLPTLAVADPAYDS